MEEKTKDHDEQHGLQEPGWQLPGQDIPPQIESKHIVAGISDVEAEHGPVSKPESEVPVAGVDSQPGKLVKTKPNWNRVAVIILVVTVVGFLLFGVMFLWLIGISGSAILLLRLNKMLNRGDDKKKEALVRRGVVHGFQQRTESIGDKQIQVWNFRIDRYLDGEPLPPIPVEMRGSRFNGSVMDGDEVEVFGHLRKGHLLQTNRVFNWTNDTEVTTGNVIPTDKIIGWILFLAAIIAILVATQIRR
jgi:hypothetical protein